MAIRIIGPAVKPPGQGEDIARSAQTGGVEGVSQLLGTVGDIQGMGHTAAQKVSQFLSKHGIGDGSLPQGVPGVPSIGDVLGMASTAVAAKTGGDPRLARLATAAMMPAAISQAPTSQEIQGAVTKDKPLYQPQTKAGKYARTIAQFAPAAAAPTRSTGLLANAVRRAANAVVPAVASEAAGQATEGTKLEPYARLAGAVAGGGLVSAIGSGGPRTRILAEATRGATDAQVGQARQLMETAQREGVQLTMAEALQQVTAGATGLGRIQRVLEGTKAASERINPVMAARPGQVRQAVGSFADTIAPATDEPSVIGLQGQRAATQVLRNAEQARTAHVQPLYEVADQQSVHPSAMEGLLSDMDAEIAADRTGIIGGQLANLRDHLIDTREQAGAAGRPAGRTAGFVSEDVPGTLGRPATPRVPLSDLGNLDRVRKFFRDRMAMPPIGADAITKEQAGRLSHYLGRLDDLMERVDEFRQGKQAFQDFTGAVNDPLTAGPLGRVAATDGVKAQTAALYPAQPLEGAPAETARAMGLLTEANPSIGRDLTRQHLVNALNEATQDNVGGPNQWGGAKYAAQIAGNPEQERTLMAGVGAAGGDTNRLADIVQVLRAQGMRERPGSMTAYNAKAIEELGNAGMTGEVLRTGLNPPGFFRRLGEGFQNWQTETNAGRLADALIASPADAEAIVMRAREVVPPGANLQAIERLALQAQLARAQGQQSAPQPGQP